MSKDRQPLSIRQSLVLGARAVGVMLTAGAGHEGLSTAQVAAASPGVEVSAGSPTRSGIRIPSIDLRNLKNCQYFRDNLQPDGNVSRATITLVSRLQGGDPYRVVEYRVSRFIDAPETGTVVVARHHGEREVVASKEDANNNPVGPEVVFNNVPSDRTVSVKCVDGSPNVQVDAVKARTEVRKMDGTWTDTNPPHIYLPENVILPDNKTIVQHEPHPAECTCPVHTPTPTPTQTQLENPPKPPRSGN